MREGEGERYVPSRDVTETLTEEEEEGSLLPSTANSVAAGLSSNARTRDGLDRPSSSQYSDSFNGRYNRKSLSSADLYYYNQDPGLTSAPRPLIHRLLSSHINVLNPNSSFDTTWNLSSNNLTYTGVTDLENKMPVEFDRHSRRLSVLNNMRPFRLIGKSERLSNWKDGYVDLKNVKGKKLRKYYEEQNYLIEKFTEVDNFLDAGKMHFNILKNYSLETENINMDEDGNDEETQTAVDERSALNQERRINYDTIHSNFSRYNENPAKFGNGTTNYLGVDEAEQDQEVLFAILVNFFINIVLLIGKIIVTILTNSMSLVASLIDSVLDFLSTFIIYVANRLSRSTSPNSLHAYPIGRSRLEPLGVLIFSVIIMVSFFLVGQESFVRLFMSTEDQRIPAKVGSNAIIIMGLTIVCKVGCWLWCSKSKSSSVQALAQDAETDVIFNIVSLIMPTVGYVFNIWWLDPLGALALSVYVIVSWCKTAFEHIDNLTGAVADPLEYKVVLYLAYRFAESISQITALKVYHVGDNLNVEIDVVFSYEELNLSIKDCHDIAEALQYSIETLPFVERAFVHIDYMEGNYRGHLK